jgi:hypothetical protein
MVKHTRLSRQRLLEKWKRIENQMSYLLYSGKNLARLEIRLI